jgi:Ca2+-binding EF-hand superfamily protein
MKSLLLGCAAVLLTAGALAPEAARAAKQEKTPAALFISPCGKPYRSEEGEPYPSIAWFKAIDTNHDGKLDVGEFRAEAEGFFKVLDINGDGIIESREVDLYEFRLVPEILRDSTSLLDKGPLNRRPGFVLALAQGRGGGGMPDTAEAAPSDDSTKPQVLNAQVGAAPYGLLGDPEPVRSADRRFDYRITMKEFDEAADRHFAALDANQDGFVTWDEIGRTPVQDPRFGRNSTF